MNREIKFRAWTGSKMTQEFHITGMGIAWHSTDNEEEGYAESTDWPIMQFTGLTDKNGKDIYEGDITEFAGNRCEIRYYEKLAAFGFYFPHDNTWLHFWECDESILRIDLIGNIYTHPHKTNPGV